MSQVLPSTLLYRNKKLHPYLTNVAHSRFFITHIHRTHNKRKVSFIQVILVGTLACQTKKKQHQKNATVYKRRWKFLKGSNEGCKIFCVITPVSSCIDCLQSIFYIYEKWKSIFIQNMCMRNIVPLNGNKGFSIDFAFHSRVLAVTNATIF